MQTQRDHVHAHQFQMGRMSSALVLGDPTSAENPSHRSMTGLLAGLILAVLIVAGFAVYGWIVPGGSNKWQAAGAIIVEKETGNRYVYLDGQLRPTLNLTSAMLIQGPKSSIVLASRKSMTGVPHGSPIGIAGAPQTVPTALNTEGWLACLSGSVGGPVDGVGINLDSDQARAAQQVPRDRFVLVTSGGSDYLVWRNHKFKITDPKVVVAFGVTNAPPIPAPKAWLDVLVTDKSLSVPTIPGRGTNGPKVAGHTFKVGQVFSQSGANGDQLFVLRKDGLAAVDKTAYLLLQSASAAPVELDSADVAAAPRSDDKSLTDLLPELGSAKWQDIDGKALCQYQEKSTDKSVNFAVVLSDPAFAGLRADASPRVNVRPGTGKVVYPVPIADDVRRPEPWLISDEGIRYSLPDNETLAALGFGGSQMVPFPRELLGLIKSGPMLSAKAIDVSEGGTTS